MLKLREVHYMDVVLANWSSKFAYIIYQLANLKLFFNSFGFL